MSRRNKHRRDNSSDDSSYNNNDDDDNSKYEEDEAENAGGGKYRTETDYLRARCNELENVLKSMRMEIRILKSHDRQTKRQMRIDYEWTGEEANLSDKVSEWCKTFLFPRYKFLKDGWMKYSDAPESLSSFAQRKLKMEEIDDFRGQWERVICPTIQMKYVTIRCNLNNKVRKTYKGKSWQNMFYHSS
jgi:hypothetical protein